MRGRRLIKREPPLTQPLIKQVGREPPVAVERHDVAPADGPKAVRADKAVLKAPGVILIVQVMKRIVSGHQRAPMR